MKTLDYLIGETPVSVSVDGTPPFSYGKEEYLSGPDTDIVYHQPWYEKGFTAENFLTEAEFADLKNGLTAAVKRIIEQEVGISTEGLTLETYHNYITNTADHFKVVGKTRDLFPEDFNFPIVEMIPKFEKILGFKLVDVSPISGEKVHIIVRINRPGSTDYNPPHKDIYEAVDNAGYVPPFVNMWIPIAGVTNRSSLPMVAGSHRLPESQINRTREGGVVAGNTYRVRMIKDWGGHNQLERAEVGYGEVLLFSSHLVHGLALNEEENLTRVALEFRLFKAS